MDTVQVKGVCGVEAAEFSSSGFSETAVSKEKAGLLEVLGRGEGCDFRRVFGECVIDLLHEKGPEMNHAVW